MDLLRLNRSTMDERVSSVTSRAQALRGVTNDSANSVGTTSIGAWVNTFLADAGEVAGTFAVADALRLAVGRYSDEVWQAGA